MRSLICRPLRAVLTPMLTCVTLGAAAQPLQPDIAVTKVINAPLAEGWKVWTTPEGIESFFAPK